MKRIYFCCLLFLSGLLPSKIFCQTDSLPVGAYPDAIPVTHFPDRLHAFVWRNWNLVSPAAMSRTIGCKESDISGIAASMGLPPYIAVDESFKNRIYITVIRRNWHLLPYDQLLKLLGMSSHELAVALKEDDFLFIKLGSLKPKVGELRYVAPGPETVARVAAIKKIAEKYFHQQTAVPRFKFIEELSQVSPNGDISKPAASDMNSRPRIVYSYFGIFGDPLSDTVQNPYPDGLLEKLSRNGVNGIWMHTVLNQLAPGDKYFPEFGAGHEVRIHNLKKIVERAGKYGIGIYLYMNEPRAMPASFFTDRAGMRGTKEGNFYAMCTSNDTVVSWMKGALAFVFKNVPGLAGVLTITASENFTNCASHGHPELCSRCSRREYADIIAGVNRTIEEGVHAGNPNARVIVWDWGWHNHGLARDVIIALPKSVYLMSVSEWAKPISRGGVESTVGEYSISAVGPGPRATQHWAWAKQAGLRTFAKVQVNNSWELSAVPWLPVFDLVRQHISALSNYDMDGLMLSWSLGGYPSPNMTIADLCLNEDRSAETDLLDAVAADRYGAAAVHAARKAWTAFSKAFEAYPYSGSTLYTAPQQYGPANLLYEKATGYRATMVGFPYDDLKSWRGIYPDAGFINQFQSVAAGWHKGLEYFQQVKSVSDGLHRQTVLSDERIAGAAYLHFASVVNQARFIVFRDSLISRQLPDAVRKTIKQNIRTILKNEISLAEELYRICREDSRIGYEASNQYYYVGQDLIEKILNCQFLLNTFKD
ncbi:MAG: hypothetical protein KF746_22920 [Chitinophagaceae bacterium]|nr:hypothetical protein [Chitinophagaceae bacterium]